MPYSVVREDVIEVKWPFLEKRTEHNIVFHGNDTLELIQFIPVDVGMTGFEDITVIKK